MRWVRLQTRHGKGRSAKLQPRSVRPEMTELLGDSRLASSDGAEPSWTYWRQHFAGGLAVAA